LMNVCGIKIEILFKFSSENLFTYQEDRKSQECIFIFFI